jgi:hypothetical protein
MQQRIRKTWLAAWVCVSLLALISAGGAADAPKPVYVQPQDIDWASILPGPPADDSPEHQAEVATLLHWQAKRTSEEAARCKSEEEVNAFVFSEVLGDWFNARSLPLTADLMNQAYIDAKAASNGAKKKWNRVRPPLADARIHPCVALEKTASYPSGHATRGVMWATILSEIFPEHREALMARGRLIGEDRVIAGMHYPSDVEAGQKLGAAIAEKMLQSRDFKDELDRVKEECMAAAHPSAVPSSQPAAAAAVVAP